MSDIKNKNANIDDSTSYQDDNFMFIADKENEEECALSTTLEQSEGEEVDHHSANTDVRDKKNNPFLDNFLQEMEKLPHTDAKVKHSLAFMESSLAQKGTPHFKSFWDVRTICLQLFKENISPALRAQYWTQYSELSKEARRLKEILDEQSSFAAEQIEIAITALENDIDKFEELVSKVESPDLSSMPKTLSNKISHYENLQKRLTLLNVQASRINAMRKELIKTEMRIRQKNKFFQRLSQAGDKIFPLRKDLIRDVSTSFSEDVTTFINDNFKDNYHEALFVLREEIKGLQGIAKILTLNTHAFTQTRMCLSECWDKIKTIEKERKKERAQLKAAFKANFDQVQQKIQDCKKQYEAGELSEDLTNRQLDEISKFMRQVELGRDEIKALRDELFAIRNQILEKVRAQEQIKHQHEQERERQRKIKNDELKNEISHLMENMASLNSQELIAARDELLEKIQNSNLNKFEKQEVERLFKPLRSSITDILSDKEEEALLALSEDDRQAIDQLKDVLKQRKERRQEIKETLRKANSASGLNFEKAMNNKALITTEKERLEKINLGIKEIEDKIAQLQKKR